LIQLDVFYKIQKQLIKDKNITGVMLMGSVARGEASPESDLDIMVLGGDNCFKTEFADNIPVEYIFVTYDYEMQKLLNTDMEAYHFLNGKITYDVHDKLNELRQTALDKYDNFKTSQEMKNGISYWLSSARIKLISAVNSNDVLKQNFIVFTNSWKVIEAIWAVNDKPVPPSSSVIRFKKDLSSVPYPDWFERLFCSGENKPDTMIKLIDWVLPKLNGPRLR